MIKKVSTKKVTKESKNAKKTSQSQHSKTASSTKANDNALTASTPVNDSMQNTISSQIEINEMKQVKEESKK